MISKALLLKVDFHLFSNGNWCLIRAAKSKPSRLPISDSITEESGGTWGESSKTRKEWCSAFEKEEEKKSFINIKKS